MSVVVLGSVRGGPGVTTTALVVAGWLPAGVVVEADMDGGVLSVRYRLGREPGLTTLAAGATSTPDGWRDHAQQVGGVPVLVGPDVPLRARALWRGAGDDLTKALAAADASVVVDAGRLRPQGPATGPLVSVADLVVILVRPEAEDLVGLAHLLHELRPQAREMGVVLAGTGSYRPDDVNAQFGLPVLGLLPTETRSAAAVAGRGGSSRLLTRSELARATRGLADRVVARIGAGAKARAPGPATDQPEATEAPTEVQA